MSDLAFITAIVWNNCRNATPCNLFQILNLKDLIIMTSPFNQLRLVIKSDTVVYEYKGTLDRIMLTAKQKS